MDRAAEVATKLDAVRAWLDKHDLDAVLFGSQAGFAWITAGGHGHVSIGEAGGVAEGLVTADRAHVVPSNIELRRIVDEELAGLSFDAVEYPWHDRDQAGRLVAQLCDPARSVSDLGSYG